MLFGHRKPWRNRWNSCDRDRIHYSCDWSQGIFKLPSSTHGLLTSRAALPNSYPDARVPSREAVCTIFMMVFGMTRPRREPTTYCVNQQAIPTWFFFLKCFLIRILLSQEMKYLFIYSLMTVLLTQGKTAVFERWVWVSKQSYWFSAAIFQRHLFVSVQLDLERELTLVVVKLLTMNGHLKNRRRLKTGKNWTPYNSRRNAHYWNPSCFVPSVGLRRA